MEEFSPQIAPAVIAACQANAAEVAAAFSRVFDTPLELAVGRAATWVPSNMPSGYSGPGLLVQLKIGAAAALVAIPESSGLIPAWYAAPDLSGAGKLATLAQELGMLVLPEQFMPEDFAAQRVSSLAAALQRSDLPVSAAAVDLTLSAADGRQALATLLWPAKNPAAVYVEPPGSKSATSAPNTATPQHADHGHDDFGDLPPYGRNLLRISVPVSVVLAAKKQPVSKILELVPGAIIQFEKSCDEMLEMEVNEQRVAQGECVKVGDKFGLRVTSLILPAERFSTVRG